MKKSKFKYLCRICGKKGFVEKNSDQDCRYCGYRYMLDAEWKFHVRQGETDGKILNFDKAHVTADLTYSGKKRKMLIEKESGKPINKVLHELNYRKFVEDSKSPFFVPVFGILIITFIAFILYSILDTDPFMHGCVYDKDFGAKIKCVEIKYNEQKNPGSEDKAFDVCMNKLNKAGKKSGKNYEIISCLSSSGPYN